MCTQFFRRFSPTDTRGVTGFHSDNGSFDIFDEGHNGVFLPIAPHEAYWLTVELRSAKYKSETLAVPWDCNVLFAFGVRVRVDEARHICLTGSEGSIRFVSDEVDQLIEFVENAERAYLDIEPPRNQSGVIRANDKHLSIRIVGNCYPDGVQGDGVGALKSHVWFRSPAARYATFLYYVYPAHYHELANWLESVAAGGSPDEFPIGGFLATQMVFDLVGEAPFRRLRVRTCDIPPEAYSQFPNEDLSLDRVPYIEFLVAEIELQSLADSIREQVQSFRPVVAPDAEPGATADGGA